MNAKVVQAPTLATMETITRENFRRLKVERKRRKAAERAAILAGPFNPIRWKVQP
jgi:hypothetical protein